MRISDWSSDVCSSDLPEAALYWLLRMLDGGCDPIYLARRLTRMAVEDIGLADPRALEMAIAAWDAFDRIGSPEGELALAQVTLYLACTAKRSEEHTSELQSLMRISYAVFCLKKKKPIKTTTVST